MRRNRASGPAAGFTLVELLITLVVLGVLLGFGLPALMNLVSHRKVESHAHNAGSMLQHARFEALKRGAPAVVALEGRELVAFTDVHGELPTDPPDGFFTPDGSAPNGTDYVIGRQSVPNGVVMEGPPGDIAGVSGFTNVGSGELRAIFDPDGSIRDTGALRMHDRGGNFLEVRVEPQATARVEVRKWDGSAWRAQGEGGSTWDWN